VSNYLTIAVVTAAIQQIVQAAVQDKPPGAAVRVGPPRAVPPGEKEVNIYLYRLSPNAELRNDDLPTRTADGILTDKPKAAIRLHYLISFAGEDHLATEIMLGRVLSVLHAMPVLAGEELARIVGTSGSFPFLAQSDLPAQREHVKLTPEYLSLEELTKLWTVFFQLAHRPSIQYVVTPVTIDADLDPVRPRRPRRIEVGLDVGDVREINRYVAPFDQAGLV
jgi:Pvc16 N-terminal domain